MVKIVVKIEDLVANTKAELGVPFDVRGRVVEPSETLPSPVKSPESMARTLLFGSERAKPGMDFSRAFLPTPRPV